MRRQNGFTLIELLVVVAIIALLIGILLPSLSRAREVANRTVCATQLKDIHSAMYTYSISNDDSFPKYGKAAGTGGTVDAFNTDSRGDTDASAEEFDDNMTAALWIMVRNASNQVKQFVCPSDRDGSPDNMQDGTNSVPLAATWDFTDAPALSYSSMNMYDDVIGGKWGTKSAGDWVFMSDDNNANTDDGDTAVHTSSQDDAWTTEEIQNSENSENHSDGEGQNFQFGDGHVEFTNDPYVGRAGDNAFALNNATNNDPSIYNEDNIAPTMSNEAVDTTNRENDAVMIPVTGNDDTNLSEEAGTDAGGGA